MLRSFLLFVVLLGAVSCGSGARFDGTAAAELETEPSTSGPAIDEDAGTEPADATVEDEEEFDEDDLVDQSNGDCAEFGIDSIGAVRFVTVHRVENGALGEICFGDEEVRVSEAWEILQAIAPAGQLFDLGLFAGFEPDANEELETLAFVNAIDDEGSQFQMSVSVDSSVVERDAIALTLVHELTHIFTALPFELDRSLYPEECETWFNGEGCYTDASLMFAWITEFWDDGLIDEIDPGRPVADLEDDGLYRCDVEPGFFGSYAASTPEEDFAESFAAYVLQMPALHADQQAKLDWIDDRPGLREFRTQAVTAGFGPVVHDFDECGLG